MKEFLNGLQFTIEEKEQFTSYHRRCCRKGDILKMLEEQM